MGGRQIKSTYRTESKQSSPTLKSENGGFGDSAAVYWEGDFHRATTPADNPAVGHPFDAEGEGFEHSDKKSNYVFPPPSPITSPGVGQYLADNEPVSRSPPSIDDFLRPTTPGNLSGVGHHSYVQEKGENDEKLVSNSSSSTDQFRPTNPGPSPGGGGHSDRN
ncbi:hypothetical protein SLEP1_g59571 [Rubroshorea leprosula]|uniref:Uncharacterized protein n=1 Tax=Rubroshorea leprosula TaxID=152421 RepID=A0AAV5MSQ0_9ROSI|nr:hypothetical protein SLEP1_g59571 [Rubroshorea leprosula]